MTNLAIEGFGIPLSACLSVPPFRYDRRTATKFGTHIRINMGIGSNLPSMAPCMARNAGISPVHTSGSESGYYSTTSM